MGFSFNVLDAPWIPVVCLDGSNELLGIRETLKRAPELREISVASPLEEYSLYRFLSVFLMDALRPEDLETIQELLEEGVFPADRIEEYISLCEREGAFFDLFDENRPFLQMPYVKEWDRDPKPISSIDCFQPSGNNHVHFEHEMPEKKTVSVDKAARLLLTIQQFCTAGAQGYPSGVNASPPYFGVIKGESLFETLVYNLLPIQGITIPFDDPPVIWRATEAVESKKEVWSTSWLRGMIFPARRVRLIPPSEGQELSEIYLSQGENFKNKEIWTDPFVTYRLLDTGRVPLRPKEEKPVWRSLYEIIDVNGNRASQVLSQYTKMTDNPYAKITFYGVETNQASYLHLMRHEIQFHRIITERTDIINFIAEAVKVAEILCGKLRHCLCDEATVPENVAVWATSRFYGLCEENFWKLCEDCAEADDVKVLYEQWCRDVGDFAMTAYSEAIERVHLRGKAMGIAAQQREKLKKEIYKIREGVEF